MFSQSGNTMYFLVYVDDLIITGNSPKLIDQFVETLSQRFSIKDLGHLHYFLGIELIPNRTGMFLCQHKYIHDLLDKTGMFGAKECHTPLSSTSSLSLNESPNITTLTDYR